MLLNLKKKENKFDLFTFLMVTFFLKRKLRFRNVEILEKSPGL